MPAKFAVFSSTASAGGASAAVMTSSSKRENWKVVCTVTRLKYAPLIGFHPAAEERARANCTEIPGNLFQITWTRVLLMDLWRPFVLSLLKRAKVRTMGPKVQWIHRVSPLPFPSAAVSPAQSRWNNKRLACIFSSFAQFPTHSIAQRKQKAAKGNGSRTLTSVILFFL